MTVLALVVSGVWASSTVVAAADSAQLAPLSDASSAPTEAAGARIAQAFDHDVEVTSLTTETQQVFATPSGHLHASISSQQQRVKQGASWVPIDLDLQAGAAGFSPKVAPVSVVFSAGGGTSLATVAPLTAGAVTETWPDGNLPTPTISGATATYPEVYPGVDLALTATLGGFSEVLVVKTPEAAVSVPLSNVRFGVSSPGAVASAVAGGLELGPRLSDPKMRIGSANWWDSSYPDASTKGPGGPGLSKSVPDQYDPTMLRLDAGSIGRTAGLTYPLYIDPAYHSFQGGVQGWTFVDTAGPNSSNWMGTGSDVYAHVGYIDSAHGGGPSGIKARAFWQMNTHGLEGKKIYGATFDVTEKWASSCTPWPAELLTAGAISSGTTWNTQPAFFTHLDTPSFAYNWSSAGIGGASSCSRTTPVTFDATYAATAAAARNYASVTLGMRTTEDDWHTWKKFTGTATLEVDYDSIPNVPYNRHTNVTSVCTTGSGRPVVGTTTPTLYATTGDPDGGNVSVSFEWWVTGGTSAKGIVTSTMHAGGYPFQATVPSGAFASGANMSWRVRAWDGIEWSAYSTWCELHLDTTQPPLPVVTSPITDFPTSSDLTAAGQDPSMPPKTAGDSGSVTFSNGGASDVRQFHYSLNDRPWVTVATPTGAAVTVTINPGLPANDLAVYSSDAANNPSPTRDYVFQTKKSDQLIASWNFGADPVNNQIVPITSNTQPLDRMNGTVAATTSTGPQETYDPSELFVYAFDGAGANGQTSSPVMSTGGSFAIAVKSKTTPTTGSQTVASQWGTTTNSYAMRYINGLMQFSISSADSSAPSTASVTVTTAGLLSVCQKQTTDPSNTNGDYFDVTAWHTWVGVWDAQDKKLLLYVDDCADPVAEATSTFATWSGTGHTTVGAGETAAATPGNYLQGSISHLLMFTGVPTPDEIHDQIAADHA